MTEISGAVTPRESQPEDTTGSAALGRNLRTVLSSTFRINLGETVVVGTSKIAGDRALIVLLTAVVK